MRRRPCWSSLLWALCFSFINTGDDAQNPVYPYMRERVSSVNYFFFSVLLQGSCSLCTYVLLRAIMILNMKQNGLLHGEVGTLGFWL